MSRHLRENRLRTVNCNRLVWFLDDSKESQNLVGIMHELPIPPYFSYNQKRHAVDFSAEVDLRQRVTRLTLVANADAEWLAFDSAGIAWRFHYERPGNGFSLLQRFLTHTVYNPVREVAVSWSQVRRYDFTELQQAYLEALEQDDDVLTQFVEQDELRKRIELSRNFQDLVQTWRWMETDPIDKL